VNVNLSLRGSRSQLLVLQRCGLKSATKSRPRLQHRLIIDLALTLVTFEDSSYLS
jgi:hypothetical protein